MPGPAGAGWPMSGVARVTNWSRDHSVTGAGQALSSVTPGQREPGPVTQSERSGDRGYDTQYATLRAPGDIVTLA